MASGESKRHPYRTATVATALVIGGLASEIIKFGYAMNPTFDVPRDACVSPWAVSNAYVSPGTSVLWQTYSGFNTAGVIVRGTIGPGEYGVQASFKAPDDGSYQWETNASDMLKGGDSGKFIIKLAVGDGPAEFGVRAVASEGSDFCNIAPVVDYKAVDQSEYYGTLATLPMPNPSNVMANVIGAAIG